MPPVPALCALLCSPFSVLFFFFSIFFSLSKHNKTPKSSPSEKSLFVPFFPTACSRRSLPRQSYRLELIPCNPPFL